MSVIDHGDDGEARRRRRRDATSQDSAETARITPQPTRDHERDREQSPGPVEDTGGSRDRDPATRPLASTVSSAGAASTAGAGTSSTAPQPIGAGRAAHEQEEREASTVRRAPADERSYRATDTSSARSGADEQPYRPGEIPTTRADVMAREKQRFGGVKVGSAFFGWLAATGMAVVLVAVLSALGLLVGAATSTDAAEVAGTAVDQTATDPTGTGLVGAIALLVVLLVAYFCGGYVAGRMARFDGLKQGVAVWVWAVVIAVLAGIVGLLAGTRSELLEQVTLPRLPVSGSDVTTSGVIFVVAVAVVTLVGAVLGGLAGMRFHRRVDRAGLGD